MLNLNRRLRELERQGQPVQVGVVGAGQMGSSLVSLIAALPGMRVTAVADVSEERARHGCQRAEVPADRVVSLGSSRDVPDDPELVRVTDDAWALVEHPSVHVVVEATGIPDVGARIALHSIALKKHVVMLNAETDATVGSILARKARAEGVVYTGTAGDEPGAIMELYDFADALGFEVLVAGKGKNNPLDRTATPDQLEGVCGRGRRQRGVLCSFVDGTKTMVEMTCVANATGFVPDVPGMHGVKAGLDEVLKRLCLRSEGGVLNRYGVVEYVDGLAPGVFVIIRSPKRLVADTLRYLKMGDGPNFILYRPYHLTSLETPISVVRAALYGEPTIQAAGRPTAETVAVAKKDLSAGEELDGIGGYTLYGECREAVEAREGGLLPLGLVVPGTVMRRAVRAGQPLTFDDVDLPESAIRTLREEQDRLWDDAGSASEGTGAPHRPEGTN